MIAAVWVRLLVLGTGWAAAAVIAPLAWALLDIPMLPVLLTSGGIWTCVLFVALKCPSIESAPATQPSRPSASAEVTAQCSIRAGFLNVFCAMLFGANSQELNVWSLSMKTLLLLSIIAAGATVTASSVRLASIPDLVASIRSITMIGDAQAQSRRDVRCRKGGYANNRYYCNLERARARGLLR
jgi:hypothetical protein